MFRAVFEASGPSHTAPCVTESSGPLLAHALVGARWNRAVGIPARRMNTTNSSEKGAGGLLTCSHDAMSVLNCATPDCTANRYQNPGFLSLGLLGGLLGSTVTFCSRFAPFSGPLLACFVERMCNHVDQCLLACQARYVTVIYAHTKSQLKLSRKIWPTATHG